MNTAVPGRVAHALGVVTRTIVAEPRAAALGARLALWVILVSLLARRTSLPRVQRIVSIKVRSTSAADRAGAPARLARTIDRLLGLDLFVFRRRCWTRALVLHRFLALHGIESRVNFGVQRHADGSMQGHAWLEHQGRPLLEDAADAYIVTFSLPRPHPPVTGMIS